MKRFLFLLLALAILAIPATASAAVGDEMLTNPGAENGSLGWDSGWWSNYQNDPAPTFTVSDDAHSGAHSLRVAWSGRIGGQYDGDAKWAQGPFPVVGGHYYSYSDWYKSSGNTELAVWVNTTTNPDDPGKWYNLDIGIASSSTWKQYNSGFMMPDNAVQAQFVHVLDDNGFLQTDDASMKDEGTTAQGFNRPIVTITQDDGTPDVKNTAIPAMDAHGFKSTQFTISGVLNQPGEWTSSDVRSIAADGHEIGSHSVTHRDEVTGTDINGNPGTITPAEQVAELRDSQATLQNILGSPVTDFAYPYGSYNNVVSSIANTYYRSSRGVEAGYQSRFDTASSLQGLRVQNITSPTGDPQNNVPPMSFADFKGWVDFAVAHNLWLILVYHGVNNNPAAFDTTPALFTQQLDYLTSKGVSVQTMQSALDETLPQVGIPVEPPVDNPPDTTITSKPASSTTSTSATFQFNANESGATFECNIDNAGFTPCVSPMNYSGLALGQHTFSVRAIDTSNQTDATPATASWTITEPATAPDTTITSGPSNPTTSTSASFAFSSSKPGSTFQCKLDGGSYSACTSPKNYSGLSRATHTFSVRATAAGLTDASPATQTWTISALPDTRAPSITITRPSNGNTYLTGQVLTAAYSCSDASGISSCVGTLPSGALIDTSVRNTNATFTVNAVDNVGNSASKTVTYRVCSRRTCR